MLKNGMFHKYETNAYCIFKNLLATPIVPSSLRWNLYAKTTEINVLHELTSYLVTNFKRVAIEDLNVSGMVKNHKLARAISDVGFGAFKEYLTYKCKMYNVNLVLVDRFFPSSKTCSKCGNVKKELKLSQRVYACNSCDLVIDRDLNASLNINQWLATGSGDN